MIPVVSLETEHLILRPVGPEDYDYLLDLHGQHGYRSAQYKVNLSEMLRSNNICWIVLDKKSREKLGTIYFTEIIENVMANIHPILDVKAVKRAQPMNGDGKQLRVMEDASKKAVVFMVERFDLQRVGGVFRAHNIPAIKLCNRIGFVKEGLIRHGFRDNGKPRDMVIMSILAQEV